MTEALIDRYDAALFDLDGVLVTTDGCHYSAWKRMADEEGIPFDETVNRRLRGVSRMESLGIILEKAKKEYSAEEKDALAARKIGNDEVGVGGRMETFFPGVLPLGGAKF